MRQKPFFHRLPLTFLNVFLLIFMLGIFGPSEIFFGNYKEFGFVYSEFGLKFIGIGFLLALLISVLLAVLPEVLSKPLLALSWGISIAGYIQVMFLNRTLGQIGVTADGYVVDSSSATKNIIFWTAILIFALAATYLLKERWKKVQQITCLILLLMQLVAFGTLFLTAEKGSISYIGNNATLTGENQYTVSSEENVILFVLDNFSSHFLNLAMMEYPDLLENFNDFTYYDNADCNYYGTYPSLAHMLTGNALRTDISINDWLYESWNNDTTNAFYDLLEEKNYIVNLYTPLTNLLTGTRSLEMLSDKIDNIVPRSTNIQIDYPLMYETLLKMSFYRFVPEYLKGNFDVGNDEYTSIVSYPDTQMQYTNPNFYNTMLETGLSVDNTSNYFIIQHLNGTHEFINDAGCQYARENTTLQAAVKGIFVMLEEYLNQLKALGVYDQSTIIITADHGSEYNTQMVFFIKEANESHEEVQITSAPITLHELMPTIAGSIGGDATEFGQTIYDFYDGEQRERSVYIRKLDPSVPSVPTFDSNSTGGMNCYYVYTYTGDAEDLLYTYDYDVYTIAPVVDSYF